MGERQLVRNFYRFDNAKKKFECRKSGMCKFCICHSTATTRGTTSIPRLLINEMSEIAIFKAENDEVEISVQLDQDTVWLSQAQISELFAKDQSVVSRHVNNVFREKELGKESNMQKMHNGRTNGIKMYRILDSEMENKSNY